MEQGTKLGHYRILEILGKGGMGEVYLAEDVRLGRRVAIKILPAEVAADAGRRARFDREAKVASALSHPNIAHIYDVGEEDGIHFIAMEYVEGSNLGELLAAGSLAEERVLDIAIQVAGALAEADAKGVIHRDIKPANIALTARGEVKVLDFGLAKVVAEPGHSLDDPTVSLSPTADGAVLGTVRYMSPEQALGKEVDTRSDLFSLGTVLYEMVAARPPFAGPSAAATLDAIIHQPPEALARFNYGVSPELERIVRKCLEKDPENRYQSARDLVVDLRNLRRAGDSQTATAAVAAARPARGRGRRFMPAVAVALAAVVAVAAYFLVPRAGAGVGALAVLPFVNETGDPELDYLCSGMTESLINTLAQVPDLKVISSRSAFAMKDRASDPMAAGRELGVDAILFGRVVQHGQQLTISTELVHTADNRQLWGERYNRPLSEIQAVENEITSTIARTLRVRLDAGQEVLVARHAATDPEAYRLYLKGLEFTTGTRREMDKAIEYFQEAIALEPDYALAYAGLAQCYAAQSYLRGSERGETVELARAAAQQAMSLDPGLADAYTAAGMVKLVFDLDWKGAEADFVRAWPWAPRTWKASWPTATTCSTPAASTRRWCNTTWPWSWTRCPSAPATTWPSPPWPCTGTTRARSTSSGPST